MGAKISDSFDDLEFLYLCVYIPANGGSKAFSFL